MRRVGARVVLARDAKGGRVETPALDQRGSGAVGGVHSAGVGAVIVRQVKAAVRDSPEGPPASQDYVEQCRGIVRVRIPAPEPYDCDRVPERIGLAGVGRRAGLGVRTGRRRLAAHDAASRVIVRSGPPGRLPFPAPENAVVIARLNGSVKRLVSIIPPNADCLRLTPIRLDIPVYAQVAWLIPSAGDWGSGPVKLRQQAPAPIRYAIIRSRAGRVKVDYAVRHVSLTPSFAEFPCSPWPPASRALRWRRACGVGYPVAVRCTVLLLS